MCAWCEGRGFIVGDVREDDARPVVKLWPLGEWGWLCACPAGEAFARTGDYT